MVPTEREENVDRDVSQNGPKDSKGQAAAAGQGDQQASQPNPAAKWPEGAPTEGRGSTDPGAAVLTDPTEDDDTSPQRNPDGF